MELEKLKAQGEANGQAAAIAEQERAKTHREKVMGDIEAIKAQGEEDRKTIAFQAQFTFKEQEDKDTRKLTADVVNKSMDKRLENETPAVQQGNV